MFFSSASSRKEHHPKASRCAETPPMLSGDNGRSPKQIIDVTKRTLQVRNEGPHNRVDRGEVTIPLPVAQRNRSDSAVEKLSDTSSECDTTLRGRARISTMPARYRQPSGKESAIESSVSPPTEPDPRYRQPSDNESVQICHGREVSSTGEKTPTQKNVKKLPARKSEGTCKGAWTECEQNLFEDGCILHGWGDWKNIHEMIPTRDRHQVKSHAQKFAKHYPEMRERLQKEHAHQRLLSRTDPFIRMNEWKQKTQIKKKPTSTRSVLSGGTTDISLSMSNIMVVSTPPESTSKSETTSAILKLDQSKNIGASPKVIPSFEIMGVLPISSPVPSHLTSNDDNTDDKSVIMVPKSGDDVLHMLAIPHGSNEPHSSIEFAGPTHDAIVAIPLSFSSPQETNKKAMDELSSAVLDQPSKRALTTSESVVECAPPIKKVKSDDEFDTLGSGSWTSLEHMQFEKGCILFGWGNWKMAESLIPSRNSIQIKSHAQKYSKSRPYQKERLMREHQEYMRQTQLTTIKDPAEKSTEQAKKQKTSTARHLPLPKYGKRKSWTSIEKKQFEDGCVFHGWGNWRDIASHIITKDISEVSAHAESYQLSDRERLKREHTLNYQDDDDDDDYIFPPGKNTKRFYHDLFLRGGKTTVQGISDSSPPKSSPNKNGDDYGAAEAILALNCADWGNDKNAKEAPSAKKWQILGSTGSPKKESASDPSLCKATVVNKANGSNEMSTLMSPKEDRNITKSACVRVDTQLNAVGVEMADEKVMDTRVDATNAECALARPRGNSQPPPHWLATDTWDICLANIYLWNNKLTESERNAEFLHYNRLSSSEKECLREKLVNLMDNRPTIGNHGLAARP
jgi:SHAQKYF class myb-like DNA-binding protein